MVMGFEDLKKGRIDANSLDNPVDIALFNAYMSGNTKVYFQVGDYPRFKEALDEKADEFRKAGWSVSFEETPVTYGSIIITDYALVVEQPFLEMTQEGDSFVYKKPEIAKDEKKGFFRRIFSGGW